MILALQVAACGETGRRATVSAPTPLEQALTLTGVVTEITPGGRTAVAGADVVVRESQPLAGRYRAFVRTDAQGRYMASQIPRATALTVVADKFECVQPAAATVVVDREMTVDIEVACGPVRVPAQSPALSGFLRDSRQPSPSSLWVYFDSACDGHFEASAISDRDGFYQLSRLPLGRACLNSHGKVVEIDVRGDARLDLDIASVP
jgi:hypothetical protein